MKPYLEWDQAQVDTGSGPWQGIDRVELVDPEADQPRLRVYLREVRGSLQKKDLAVRGRDVASLSPTINFPVDTKLVEIQFARRGGRGLYYVELLSGGGKSLQPFFALAEFQFAINCEAPDCRKTTPAPVPLGTPTPPLDHLTKDYAGFVQVLADRIRVSNPHWADLSPASLERVLVELLAHQGDMLSYYQDRVANEAFVGTATQRHSLRQHGLLLGYTLDDGASATTVLGVTVGKAGFVPAGLRVQSSATVDEAPVTYSASRRTRVSPAFNPSRLKAAAWPGATTARIPAGSTGILLWGQNLGLDVGQRLALVQDDVSQLVTLTSVIELDQEGWVQDPSAAPTSTRAALTAIAWSDDDRLLSPLYPWRPVPDGTEPAVAARRRLRIFGNLVDAVHGAPRFATSDRARQLGRQVVPIAFDERSATVTTVQREGGSATLLRALLVPEAPVAFDAVGDGSAPALEVRIDGQLWYRQEHLHGSLSQDRHYVAVGGSDGSVWIELGDGVRGAAVPCGAGNPPRIELRYRLGEPSGGNCAAHTLTRVVPFDDASSTEERDRLALSSVEVTNVIPGTGARPRESNDAARESIPGWAKGGPLERAVTIADFAAIAQAVPGVARAVVREVGGPFGTVMVLIDPRGQGELGAELRERVARRLDAVRMVGREVRVDGARYVPLEIELALCVQPGWPRHQVREAVLAALRPGSDDHPGFFHPDRLSFAQSVELGDVLAHVQRVAGVRSVKALRFRRVLRPSDPPVLSRITLSRFEIARLDGEETSPQSGRLAVKVVGLDPGLEDNIYTVATTVASGGKR